MRTRIFVALGAALLLAAGAQAAWSRVGGHAGAAASFRLVTVASGLSSPVYATVGAGRQAAVRGRAGGHDPHREQGQGRGQALRRPAALRQVRRRAGPALRGVLAELRRATASSTSTSRTRRATRSSGSCTRARAQRASAPVIGSCSRSRTPSPTTTAGSCSSGPTGCSTSAMATAAAAAISTARTATGRTRASCSAS